MRFAIGSIAVLCLALGSVSWAAPSSGCADVHCREFDFWIGNWRVETPDGQLAGTNRIDLILGGCALQENWSGARGLRGMSVNFFDADDERWHQTWIDAAGNALFLAGGLVDGVMVLEGSGKGDARRSRISWSKLEAGRVRQLWEISTDAGASWQAAFDGTYIPAEGAQSTP